MTSLTDAVLLWITIRTWPPRGCQAVDESSLTTNSADGTHLTVSQSSASAGSERQSAASAYSGENAERQNAAAADSSLVAWQCMASPGSFIHRSHTLIG